MLCGCLIVLVLTLAASLGRCYIPASPTNSTNSSIAGSPNVTDVSVVHLQWFAKGSYVQTVSYEVVGQDSTGVSQGALVHFSEASVNNQTNGTTTPWIALVSCDFNATEASLEEDIFTLARDKGAVAALLYSEYSSACVINPEYADPTKFDQVFDIFSTQSLTQSLLIDYQFGQIGSLNETLYGSYDSQRLNDSGTTIRETINARYLVAPGYLFATLVAYNATNASSYTNVSSNNENPGSNSSGSGSNSNVAMVVLYAITGCVSALFCVVIVSGAIRALRHPERYGPRARRGDGDVGMLQSRAQGLTRAILDTFPIVKFGSQLPVTTSGERDKDPEAGSITETEFRSSRVSVELKESSYSRGVDPECPQKEIQFLGKATDAGSNLKAEVSPVAKVTCISANGASGVDRAEGSSRPAQVVVRDGPDDVVPDAIGRETCPICIVDFEDGDDLRVLPCEGHHRFHQQCVDPWLLELSSACPLCRHDFLALETMLSGGAEEENLVLNSPMRTNRFSRYIRSAIHRRQHRLHDEPDPTNPYFPTAPHTSM